MFFWNGTYTNNITTMNKFKTVLILVLLEWDLYFPQYPYNYEENFVLILVLLEWDLYFNINKDGSKENLS